MYVVHVRCSVRKYCKMLYQENTVTKVDRSTCTLRVQLCTRTTYTYVVRVLKSRLKKLKKVNGYTYVYTYSMAFFFLLRSQSFSEFLANQRRDRGEKFITSLTPIN
jgi:hypothetical protein